MGERLGGQPLALHLEQLPEPVGTWTIKTHCRCGGLGPGRGGGVGDGHGGDLIFSYQA